jgi:hypothetical protein
MYNASIKADAEMMFQLTRSELADGINFNAGDNRDRTAGDTLQQWVTAEPRHFQIDGEIVAEVGSTWPMTMKVTSPRRPTCSPPPASIRGSSTWRRRGMSS